MKLVFLLIVPAAMVWAAEPGERADLSGTWRLDAAGDRGKTFAIQQSGDEISIREFDAGGKVHSEMKCGTKGVECPVKIGGDTAQVTYYFYGPTLVEHLWKGKNVVKTRRTLSPDGEKMTVEVMSMSPPGPTEKFEYVKSAAVAVTR